MQMNSTQRVVVVISLTVIASVCVNVPWKMHTQGGQSAWEEYSFIWSPPVDRAAIVDIGRVILEIIAVAALGGAAFLMVGGQSPTKAQTATPDEKGGKEKG